MNARHDDLALLTQRARQGDPLAAARVRRRLEPVLVHMVRRAFRDRGSARPVDAHIVAEIRRVVSWPPAPGFEAPGHVVRDVARRLCDSVVRPPAESRAQWSLDTVLSA
jgi:hypothetical protein